MGASPITGALWQKARLGLLGLGALALFMLIFVSIDQSYEVVIASLLSSRNLRGEPPRDCRRRFGLSYAATGVSSCIA
jgi:hypothetical protein